MRATSARAVRALCRSFGRCHFAARLAATALGLGSGCGPAVVDHTPSGNLFDADTESLEGGLGHWETWFSTSVARTDEDAQRGHASLRITVTAPYGWGVGLDNWPGFSARPGLHRLDVWARSVSGRALDLTSSIRWRNEAGDDLQTDMVQSRLGAPWTPAGRDLTAPPGTTRATIELTGSEGGPGDTIDVDEIFLL